MLFNCIGGFISLFMGGVIFIGSVTTTKDISSMVVGGLFIFAGVVWILTEIKDKNN